MSRHNLCENTIRPFVVGRKGWLFSDTVTGAQASANLYSLVETCKANGIEPYAYLRWLFRRLPLAQTVDDYDALLPWKMSPELRDADPKQACLSLPPRCYWAVSAFLQRSRFGG